MLPLLIIDRRRYFVSCWLFAVFLLLLLLLFDACWLVEAHRYTRRTTTRQSNETTTTPAPLQCTVDRAFPQGTVIEIKCPDGFEFVGSSSVGCTENSTWNGGDIGFCQKKVYRRGCSAPPTPSNGFMLNQEGLLNCTDAVTGELRYDVGATIRFSCTFCYVLKGFATITCRSDGTWSGQVPTCQLGYYFIDNRIARC